MHGRLCIKGRFGFEVVHGVEPEAEEASGGEQDG